jgi:SAM-dependent methyltransferase
MTGFSAEWLALREPVDHASVDAQLRARMAALFAARPTLRIVDLGSGSGSSLRGLAPYLPDRQVWRLVDYDPVLLDHARGALAAWADAAADAGAGLQLRCGDKQIAVEFLQADVSQGVSAAITADADVITSAAFFDLVSEPWIARFASALQERELPLYSVLTYNGQETWRPPHAADSAMLAAFHADQHRDKGFGPASGPDAARLLSANLKSRGFNVFEAESPWRLGSREAQLIEALADGSASAVAATGTIPQVDVENWRMARRSAEACIIGHRDLLALPAAWAG